MSEFPNSTPTPMQAIRRLALAMLVLALLSGAWRVARRPLLHAIAFLGYGDPRITSIIIDAVTHYVPETRSLGFEGLSPENIQPAISLEGANFASFGVGMQIMDRTSFYADREPGGRPIALLLNRHLEVVGKLHERLWIQLWSPHALESREFMFGAKLGDGLSEYTVMLRSRSPGYQVVALFAMPRTRSGALCYEWFVWNNDRTTVCLDQWQYGHRNDDRNPRSPTTQQIGRFRWSESEERFHAERNSTDEQLPAWTPSAAEQPIINLSALDLVDTLDRLAREHLGPPFGEPTPRGGR